MKCLAALGCCLALLASSCDGDAGPPTEDPPWDLTSIDMPNTPYEVKATISALPGEIDGRGRSGGGPESNGVMYGESFSLILQAQPSEELWTFAPPGIKTPDDWLEYVGSGRMGGIVEERGLTGDLLWVTATDARETAPGQMGTTYLLYWARHGGSWVFFVEADSEAGRVALVDAFVTAFVDR